jgi:hypothetical protein
VTVTVQVDDLQDKGVVLKREGIVLFRACSTGCNSGSEASKSRWWQSSHSLTKRRTQIDNVTTTVLTTSITSLQPVPFVVTDGQRQFGLDHPQRWMVAVDHGIGTFDPNSLASWGVELALGTGKEALDERRLCAAAVDMRLGKEIPRHARRCPRTLR